ncbi:hypothetical protein ES703_87145 [subsurface metagenome]
MARTLKQVGRRSEILEQVQALLQRLLGADPLVFNLLLEELVKLLEKLSGAKLSKKERIWLTGVVRLEKQRYDKQRTAKLRPPRAPVARPLPALAPAVSQIGPVDALQQAISLVFGGKIVPITVLKASQVRQWQARLAAALGKTPKPPPESKTRPWSGRPYLDPVPPEKWKDFSVLPDIYVSAGVFGEWRENVIAKDPSAPRSQARMAMAVHGIEEAERMMASGGKGSPEYSSGLALARRQRDLFGVSREPEPAYTREYTKGPTEALARVVSALKMKGTLEELQMLGISGF